jgi:hypothetical protein
MRVSNFTIAGFLVLMIMCVSSVFAQSDRGGITGRVTDPNGAIVADAKGDGCKRETGETREARTNGEGNYTIPQLPAVAYTVKVEAQGFKTASVENIKVAVQVIRTVDVTLEVGEMVNTVTVSGDATPILQTENPAQQLNVSERQVRELPLLVASESGGRSPLSFIFLDSSVVSNDRTPTGSTSGAPAQTPLTSALMAARVWAQTF